MSDVYLSIIIPVYNGETTIQSLFNQIDDFCKKNQFKFEVIFVWDCGIDDSWKVIEAIQLKHPGVVCGIHLSRNFGQHNAILAGINKASGNYIITMDEDLQHDPKDILLLLEKQKSTNADVVYGKYSKLNHPLFRNITSRIMRKLLQIGLPDLHNEYSAFRLIKSSIAKETTKMSNSYTFLDGYLSWLTNNVNHVIVSHNERKGGKSAYSTKQLVEHSINIFVTFSKLPTRLLGKLSFIIFCSTFIYSIYILLRVLIRDDMSMGFPTIIILLGVGVGSIMLGIGVLGEYLYRVNLKTTKRPNYFIKKILD